MPGLDITRHKSPSRRQRQSREGEGGKSYPKDKMVLQIKAAGM